MFADRQGSVIWVTQPAAGTVVAGYEYDGYGQITQTGGTLQQPYGYTGREYDAESGLVYLRARYYDPRAGLFLQQDPLGFAAGDMNIYRYVGSDPLNSTDPSGLLENTYKKGSPEYKMVMGIDQSVRRAGLPKIISGVGLLAAYIAASLELIIDLAAEDGQGDPDPAPEPQPSADGGAGGNFHNHHCYPVAYGGAPDQSSIVSISVERHQNLHRLMRKYFQQFISLYTKRSMDYARGRKGADVVHDFTQELVNDTIRQFYEDYADPFPECAGG